MPPAPTKIAIANQFAASLQRHLTVPHEIIALDGHSDEAIQELLNDTDVLVSGLYKPEWQRDHTLRPLLVHSVGAGIDGISLDSLPRRATVCNVHGHERGVAERVFMHALALNQGLLPLDRALREGDWTPARPFLPELRQKNLLILGFGHIGRELVRWGQFLDMKVTVLTRTATPDRTGGLELAAFGPLDQLSDHLPEADFVVVAIPSADNTIGFIGQVELQLMKPTAFIINVGRGPVIDEAALYDALKNRRIAGAGLDVWWRYPSPGEKIRPASLPFHELDNVIMTPHKPTIETMAYRWGAIAENIARYVKSKPMLNIVWRHPA